MGSLNIHRTVKFDPNQNCQISYRTGHLNFIESRFKSHLYTKQISWKCYFVAVFKFKPNLSFEYTLRIQTEFTHDLLDHCQH